jgi:hypothetical protein
MTPFAPEAVKLVQLRYFAGCTVVIYFIGKAALLR